MNNLLGAYKSIAGHGVVQKTAYAMYRMLHHFLLNKNIVDTNGMCLAPRQPFLPSARGDNFGRSVVCVSGFGHSGSGAVVDLLSEYKGVEVIGYVDKNGSLRKDTDFEFNLLRATGGLFSMESQYQGNGDFLRGDAIRLFLRLVAYLYLEIGGRFNDDFLTATRDFLDKLLVPSPNVRLGSRLGGYNGRNHLSVCGTAGARLIWGDCGIERIFSIRQLSVPEYRLFAHEYVSKVLNIITSEKLIVLDQAVSDCTGDMDKYRDYLGPVKCIAVYRDPRDSYATGRILNECWMASDPKGYVEILRQALRPYWKLKDKDFLLLRFEDLVKNYDHTVLEIERFLGLSSDAHAFKKSGFDPEISAKNVGIHKSYGDQESVSIVAEMMPECLYTPRLDER